MTDPDRQIHETTTEARAGTGHTMTRQILFWGTGLVVVAFIVIVLVGRS